MEFRLNEVPMCRFLHEIDDSNGKNQNIQSDNDEGPEVPENDLGTDVNDFFQEAFIESEIKNYNHS
jgi:hypothetical protein